MPEAKLVDGPRSTAGETVLIVDDEPTVRILITEMLEDLDYAAIEAADSVSGLKMLQSDVRIDLLITDIGLRGGLNGRQWPTPPGNTARICVFSSSPATRRMP